MGQLADYPKSGSKPQELKGLRYRQIVEPPGQNSYREEGSRVIILHIMRGERLLRLSVLAARSQLPNK
jgi:plasmid stabilization system protein ParE